MFETPSWIISLVPSVAVLAVCICTLSPDEVFASSAEFAGLSLDLLRPSPVSCNTVGDPDVYLGAKVKRMEMPNGVQAWALSSSKYVQEAVQNVENYLRDELSGWTLRKRAPTPFMSEYDPNMDMTKQVSAELATYSQSQIGILCWMVEMGRIDIATEVSLLASHVALPREGHLEAVLHMYAYLKHKHNSHLALDPTYPQVHMGDFVR